MVDNSNLIHTFFDKLNARKDASKAEQQSELFTAVFASLMCMDDSCNFSDITRNLHTLDTSHFEANNPTGFLQNTQSFLLNVEALQRLHDFDEEISDLASSQGFELSHSLFEELAQLSQLRVDNQADKQRWKDIIDLSVADERNVPIEILQEEFRMLLASGGHSYDQLVGSVSDIALYFIEEARELGYQDLLPSSMENLARGVIDTAQLKKDSVLINARAEAMFAESVEASEEVLPALEKYHLTSLEDYQAHPESKKQLIENRNIVRDALFEEVPEMAKALRAHNAEHRRAGLKVVSDTPESAINPVDDIVDVRRNQDKDKDPDGRT